MVHCWRSFLILSQIILESYSQLPDVDLVESDIRGISEGYPQSNHGIGIRQQEQLKFRSKSLQYIHSEHAPASSARNVTIMVEDDPEDEKQNIVEDPLRFPFGRIRDSSTSSGDLSGSSKFGDRNDIDQDSGQTDSDVKIWYGDEATEGEFPFMARVKAFKSYRKSGSGAAYGMCGGSIISPRIVLTAAHCVVVSRETWHELESPVHYEVIVGDHSSRFNTNERAYKAEGVIIHPDYDNGATIANDIAMIILAEDIQFTDGVSMIKIPETSDAGLLDEGQTVTVAGWGGVETGGTASTLQKMEYLFSNRVWCKRYWYYRRMDINDGMICTDRVSLSGGRYAHIWSGDSGSALFSKSEDGSFTQLALVSWSSSLEQIEAPDVHTNVFYYRDWIKENTDLLESTYLQKSRAFYGTYQELEFTDFRHFLFRRTNLYSLSSNLVIEADVTLIDISINHFVMIYDGADIEEDKMIAMLTRNEELTNIISSSNEGLTIVMQTNDRGDLGGRVKVRYQAILPPSGGSSSTSLKCPNGFWPCVDDLYCIRDSDVCDNVQGSSGQCKDASDEDEGCSDEGGDADNEGWISVVAGRTAFSAWNSAEQSISLQSYSYKASWDTVELEISHKTAGEPVRVEIKFGEVQLHIRVTNCTEYFFGLDYPSSFTSGGANEYVLSFNDNFMSILGNEEILWNFYYNGNLAMESCSKAIQGISTTGKFAAEDTATEKYKLISKPGNDQLDIEPDPTFIKDYSEFDSIPFSAILRDTYIQYDMFKYPLQIVTRGTIDVDTGIVIDIFHEDSEVSQSFIEIFFYKSAPAYYLQQCMENIIFFPMPEPDENGDRVWTIEMDKTEVVFRCNGREFGRVVAGTNTLQDCASLLDNNGKLNRIKFPSQYDAASDAYRVLCLDGCVNIDLWRPIGSYYVEFQWDIDEFSLQYITEDGKGSELVNLIGFYESEEKFYEYRHVATYHGKTHFWVWIRNCTEYWIPLRYQTVFDEVGDSFSATFTFHKNYASVLSNGELMWNFYYDSDVAMDLCQETISRYFSNAFFYYGNEKDPKSKDKLRLVGRPSNDSELIRPEPDFKDFSQFDGQRFAEFTSKNPIDYDLVNLPLQLKTEVDVPEFSNFSLSLLNTKNEEIGSITIGFWKFAAYFLILPCHEGGILMSIPEPLVGSKTRIWTVEPSESTIILRCNGYELGRVAKGSNLVLDTCDDIFGGTVSSISVISPIPVFYRLLCSDTVDCAPCSAGNYMTETGCKQCGENTFSEDGASSCTKCPDGQTSSVGSTSQDDCYFAPCSAGYYMTETGCKQCGVNTFSEDGASKCTDCPERKISTAGSISQNDCHFAPCSAGNYMTETGCQQCGENTFSEDGASSCTKCPDGQISSVGSTSLDDCYFAPCSAGNYMTETGCQQCGENTFSEDGASSCTKCPDGQISSVGSTSLDDCYEDNKVRYKFKMVPARYQSHLGLLMISLEEEEDWMLVCGVGAGRNEADTVCRSMGYRTGVMIDTYVREFYSITARTSYQVSNMKCPEGATSASLSDCSYTPYESSGVPCFRGEEVKVSCSNEPFQLTNTDFYVRIHRRGYTMFKCSAKALRFGIEVHLEDTAEAMALHRKYNGEISVVQKKLYYKGKRSYWISRTKITPPSWSDRCFVCVIQIRDIGYLDVVLSDLCDVDKDQVLEEVKASASLS